MLAKLLISVFLACILTVAEAFSPRLMSTRAVAPLCKHKPLYILLHDAALEGNFEKVKEIIEADPQMVSKYDIDGQIPLHFAAKGGHYEMSKWLIEKGPGYVNFRNIRFRTPLHWATSYAGYEGFDDCEKIAYMLVENGADLKIQNKDLQTPLDHAKKGPLGKAFHDKLKELSKGVEIRPVDIGANRVYWG